MIERVAFGRFIITMQRVFDKMATGESVSDVTMTSSFHEQVAFFQANFGLDSSTARLLYKADCFLEKGELSKAAKFYALVLQEAPQCTYAAKNVKAVKELHEVSLQEDTVAPLDPKQIEMSVDWTAFCGQYDDDDYDEMAFKEAKAELSEKGFAESFLRLIENEVLGNKNVDNQYIETKGRAHFRVTLIPDRKETITESSAHVEILDLPATLGVDSDDIPPKFNISAGLSRFADASEL